MNISSILCFEDAISSSDERLTRRVDLVLERTFPPIEGWERTISKGGILANGLVTYVRHTRHLKGVMSAFLQIDRLTPSRFRLSATLHASMAEQLPGDERHYLCEGGYFANLPDVATARSQLKEFVSNYSRGVNTMSVEPL